MSLINQMLQDLDARGSDGGRGGLVHSEVRAVAETPQRHFVWWLALVFALILGSAASWLWMRTTGMPANPAQTIRDQEPSLQSAPVPAMPAAAASVQSTQTTQPALADVPAAPVALGNTMLEVLPATLKSKPAPERKPAATPIVADNGSASSVALATAASAPSAGAPRPSADATNSAESKPEKVASAAPADFSTVAIPVKQIQVLSPQQRAENDYRRAATLIANGKTAEAIALLEHALSVHPQHAAARQSLVGLLLDANLQDDAVRKLEDGLSIDSAQIGLAMILARLQLEKGDLKAAVESLQRSLPHAGGRADYYSFLAALLQRQGQHGEAISHYMMALRSAPQNALWWMGMAISLQAENRLAEAHDAFSRAKAGNTLAPELQAFVEQRLAQLPR